MSTSSGNAKKARLRFTYNDDLVLLREFVRENPFLVPGDDGWDVLRRNVEILTGKGFTLRTLKQHLILLIELWLKKDKIDNVRSGIEGTCSEKDTLLQEKENFKRESQLLELGKEARINYAIKFSDDDKENEIATEEEMCLDVQNEEEVGYSVDDHN
ncbi:hypothetical protein FQR65_LT19100 [Abscondita terminalis]|nr:hypothetical protein FQR65_LT19100 [Abscondita terminalis]